MSGFWGVEISFESKRLSLNSFARVLAAYALVNAPFWWLAHQYFLSRPWLNVELMVPVVLAVFSTTWAMVFLAGGWLVDWVLSQSATFYFTSPLDFLRSAQFLTALSWREFLTADRLVLVLPFVLSAWALPKLVPRRQHGWRSVWVGVGVVALVALLDVFNGSSMASARSVRWVDVNLAGSPTTTLTVRALSETDNRPLRPLAVSDSAQGLVDVVGWARQHPLRSVIVVVVESLGWHQSDAVRAWLQDRLWDASLASRYRMAAAPVPFNGSTTNGELRELCNVSGSYRKVPEVAGSLECLPKVLADMGWTTSGLHGFSRAMFMRTLWWPQIGIEHAWFGEDLVPSGGRQCGGAFSGACDDDVLARGFEMARAPRQFVYVLTLNSHLPLRAGEIAPALKAVCDRSALQEPECQLTALLGTVMTAIHQGLSSAPRGAEPLVLVVGDHAPPFAIRALRQAYSQTHVPAYALVPLI